MTATAELHSRDVRVDCNGLATITVSLENVEFRERLVLATVAPPYTGVEFDEFASTDQGELKLERDRNRRGVSVAAIRSSGVTRLTSLTWKFRVANAYPFTARDLVVPKRNFYQEHEGDRVARSYVLRIDCARLKLRLGFDSADSLFRYDNVTALVESAQEKWHGVGHRWVPVGEQQPQVVVDVDNTFSVTFEGPVVGRRYAIACTCSRKSGLVQNQAGKPWTESVGALTDLIGLRSRQDPAGLKLQGSLRTSLMRELKRLYESVDPNVSCTVAGFLWNPDQTRLQPIYGRFPSNHWGAEFSYGEGVAGHSFRFNGVATYHRTRNATLLYHERGVPFYDWVVCVPLRFGEACIGVVSFAGRGEPSERVSTELVALANATQPLDATLRKQCDVLTFGVNMAFLSAIAGSELLSNGTRQRLLTLFAQFRLDQSDTDATPPPSTDVPSRRNSLAPDSAARSSRPRSQTPFTQSLYPWSVGPQSGAPNPKVPVEAKRRRLSSKVLAALATGVCGVVGTTVAVVGKTANTLIKDVSSAHAGNFAPSASLSAPPASGPTPLEPADLRELLRDPAHLQELAGLGKLARAVCVYDANLRALVLRGAPLSGFNLESCDFGGTDLSSAVLDDARLFNARMDRCLLRDAHLTRADLRKASLLRADMKKCVLDSARLDGAVLKYADLSDANLTDADLTDADLTDANLTGVDLRDTRGLVQKQVRCACSNGKTLMPEGFPPLKRCRTRR